MSYLLIILLIGLLILIHELGHFIAAKISGISIARFSIGFGPKIWSRKFGETEYSISPFPFGGYVLPAINDVSEFYKIPWRKRFIFALGGPFANILFALFGIILLNFLSGNMNFHSMIIDPLFKIVSYFCQIINSITSLFKQHENLSGIIGIVSQGSNFVGFSITKMLQFSVMLNINLAVFNLLPLPPLDGGNITLYLFEKIHPKFLKLHMPFAISGWILLIALMLYATILDIAKISSGLFS